MTTSIQEGHFCLSVSKLIEEDLFLSRLVIDTRGKKWKLGSHVMTPFSIIKLFNLCNDKNIK